VIDIADWAIVFSDVSRAILGQFSVEGHCAMVLAKPTKLVIDCPALARWLTSNPQHFNPRNAIARSR